MEWWQAAPIIREHEGVLVVRDDLLEGGTKVRFLPQLLGDAKEVVYGSPFCGGAALALSVWGKYYKRKVTIFYAERKHLHWKQKMVLANGAEIVQVPAGRMTVVQHRARTYAAKVGALFLPLGFDLPQARASLEYAARRVSKHVGHHVDEVWCATGSGMLAGCLARVFLDAKIYGVSVGLASRHLRQDFPSNVRLIIPPYKFEESCPDRVPFPCDRNYETKAWVDMIGNQRKVRTLFWNVSHNNPEDPRE